MANDYATLLISLMMAYQLAAPHWARGQEEWRALLWPVASLPVLALVGGLSFAGLRLGWIVSGCVLSGYAVRRVWRGIGPHRPMLSALDGAGGWVALMLAGANPLAVLAGASAGMVLPLAVGPWPRTVRRLVGPLEAVLMGAVGLRALLSGLVGPQLENWPVLVLAIPWLMFWDWRAAVREAG
ncbi:MAG: hypothetical protein M1272_06160 [Firmicutes bacterium]|nr:hypothetical protein [Bacillota bacterium]